MLLTPEQLASTVADDQDEAQVRATVLDTDYAATKVGESALRIARLLLFRWPGWKPAFPDFPNKTDTTYEQWIDRYRERRRDLRTALIQWTTGVRGPYILYPIFLLNRAYARAPEIMHQLLVHESPPPPYLQLLFYNLFRQALGVSCTEISQVTTAEFGPTAAGWINQLMSTRLVDDWLARKKQPLKYYGGNTNTVLGMYDALCASPDTGFAEFNRDAEARYDFGGGFNTSEIERITGRSFVSADIRGPRPRDYDGDLIVRQWDPARQTSIVAADPTRDAFLARQDAVGYLPFDVFHDAFPSHHGSYAIFSSGFLTSTIAPSRASRDVRRAGLGPQSTSVHGLARIVQLAARGVPVDLFTIQRAGGRVYKYKTCLLQWRAGKLTRLVTTDDMVQARKWSEATLAGMRAAIAPDNPKFVALLPAASTAPGG